MVIAREHAKQELKNKTIEEKRQNMNTDISVQSVAGNATLIKQAQIDNDTDEQKIKASLHYISNDSGRRIKLEKLPQPIGTVEFTFCLYGHANNDKRIILYVLLQIINSILLWQTVV